MERSEAGTSGGAIRAHKLSKEAINELPLAHWQGPVQLITTTEEALR